jgi:hypothetical protein
MIAGTSTLMPVASEWERLRDVATGMADRLADQARQAVGDFSASQARGIWDQSARTLGDHYGRLAQSLTTSMNISWGVAGGPQPPAAYPLQSRAGYSLASAPGSPFTPSVEIYVDFLQEGTDERGIHDYIMSQRSPTALRYTARIIRAGQVLSEGPTGVIDVRHGALGSYAAIRSAIGEIGRFIDGSGPLIHEQLRLAAS